jgi:hypothetical protein
MLSITSFVGATEVVRHSNIVTTHHVTCSNRFIEREERQIGLFERLQNLRFSHDKNGTTRETLAKVINSSKVKTLKFSFHLP